MLICESFISQWSNVETIEAPINTEHPSPVWLMSGDGRVFAYRALQDINGTDHGVVKVFGYDPSSQVFTSRGTINPGGNPGFPMSSSNDGSIISVCGRGYDSSEGLDVGVCGVYKYNEDENNPNYEQQGLFYGEAQNDKIRADISGDGAVLAVSYEVGRKVKVFYWDAGEWKPKGNVITGVDAYGHRLSDDGSTLALRDSWDAAIYKYNSVQWVREGTYVIYNEDEIRREVKNVEISGDGSTFIAGTEDTIKIFRLNDDNYGEIGELTGLSGYPRVSLSSNGDVASVTMENTSSLCSL